jgi:hypothetical protein
VSGWGAFYDFEQASLADMLAESNRLKHVTIGNMSSIGSDVSDTATTGIEWINNHPADACYSDAQDDVLLMFVEWGLLGVALMEVDADAITTTGRTVTDQIGVVNDAIDTATIVCAATT